MTKHGGKYYLQYACPGTQYNTYADGVYVGGSPLGPFTRQAANPFSAVTGGFLTGAGTAAPSPTNTATTGMPPPCASASTMTSSAGWGCSPPGSTRTGCSSATRTLPSTPTASPPGGSTRRPGSRSGCCSPTARRPSPPPPRRAATPPWLWTRTSAPWWSAAGAAPGQWLAVDLGRPMDVRAVQVDLADQDIALDLPPEAYGDDRHTRHIELKPQISHYTIEASTDGETWQTLETVARECSNGYYEWENGVTVRYIRVVGGPLPYGQPLRIAGLRVFGCGGGAKPAPAQASAQRRGGLDAVVRWQPLAAMGAQGVNIRYGIAPDKLYLSHLVYGAEEAALTTLTAGQNYYIAVDSFNENGVTPAPCSPCSRKERRPATMKIQTGVQQFMLGTALNREAQARRTLAALKDAGYTGIELCGFMIHPTGLLVRALTRAAGMPTGRGGKLDWHALVKESGLAVISLHTDLGSVERDAAAVAAEAKSFGTAYAVITGMYRFAYADAAAWHDLAARLNKAGAALAAQGVQLLYHNHNCELQRVEGERRGYDILLAETDPAAVNFEFDSYWFAEGGADVAAVMKTLGSRMKLWHINDRGTRLAPPARP